MSSSTTGPKKSNSSYPPARDTDDVSLNCPIRSSLKIRAQLEELLQRGQEYFDCDGNRLFTVDEIGYALLRDGRVMGPKVRKPSKPFDPFDTDKTAVGKF
jgi:hypothetical protein